MTKNSWLRLLAPPPPLPINCGSLNPNSIREYNPLILKIYPNPTSDFITISTKEKGLITIRDLTGRIIKKIEANEISTTIDLTNQVTGIYLLEFRNENGVSIQKIIKQ